MSFRSEFWSPSANQPITNGAINAMRPPFTVNRLRTGCRKKDVRSHTRTSEIRQRTKIGFIPTVSECYVRTRSAFFVSPLRY